MKTYASPATIDHNVSNSNRWYATALKL